MSHPVSPNRWIGTLPKIGIRPTIDGRRKGVRESLEDTTMNQARATAAFLSANLHYPNGAPVECVIADTCIGGVVDYQIPFELYSLPESPRLRVQFNFPVPFHEACEVTFNNGTVHPLPWGPYTLEIERSELRPSGNMLNLRVFTTLIRSFEGQEFDPLQHKYVPIG